MKKILLFAAAVLFAVTSAKAQSYYIPEEFVESEWNYIGMGSYSPGFLDCFGQEEGGTIEYPYSLDSKVWQNIANPNRYYIDPQSEELNPESYLFLGEFIVEIKADNNVFTTPIWCMHPLLFCFYHQVPEEMGRQGSAANYGVFDPDSRVISFPAGSHRMQSSDLPMIANNAGTFAVEIPDPASVGSIATDNEAPVYYNMQGVKVANPEHGIFIEKRGNKTTKVVK